MEANGDQKDESKEQATLPPYISYSSFTAFVRGLKETGVPSRIDRSVLKKMSGSQQSGLIAALRFLGLTDQTDKPLPVMRQLAAADDQSFNLIVRQILESAYGFLHDSGLDLESATGAQVAEVFRKTGATGSTVAKVMSFYLAAARAAGIKLSSHIKPPSTPKPTGTRRSSRRPPDDGSGQISNGGRSMQQAPPAPSLQEQLLAKFPTFDPGWDADTQKKWFDSFAVLMERTKEGK